MSMYMADSTNEQLTPKRTDNNQMLNLEPNTMQVQMSFQQRLGNDIQPPMILIGINEYNTLKRDNESMRAQLVELNNKYIEEIKVDKATIDELREENARLKEQLKTLNETIDTLRNDINELKYDKMINKVIFAIQDFNSEDKLEKVLTNKRILKRLRNDRNNKAHYVDDDDTEPVKMYKKVTLYNTIVNMEPTIKTFFNTKYPKLLNELTTYYKNKCTIVVDVSDEDKEDVAEYWNE